MRKFTKLLVGTASAMAAVALVAGTVTAASADPIGKNGKPATPAFFDIVGTGSNTTQYVMDQISIDYNNTVSAKAHAAGRGYLYSWDAIGSANIVTKAGCKPIARPNGSKAGLAALTANTLDGKTKHFCVDYARSSSGRSSSSPKFGPGGVAYVAFARDALTYATRLPKFGGTDAPGNLTIGDLTAIYLCDPGARNWKAFGGKNATIMPFLPQSNSGTRSFFLKAINVTNPGSCVSDGTGPTGSIEENEGTNKLLNNAAAIFPFSVGAYVEQAFHSAKCGVKPTKTQNRFGCNAIGVLGLNRVNGIAPLVATHINLKLAQSPMGRTLYNIVRFNTVKLPIPGYLRPIFASRALKGYICTSPVAARDISNYGFLPSPTCGIGS
jgi:ABC-type phosphate transport system substrate-binding protein